MKKEEVYKIVENLIRESDDEETLERFHSNPAEVLFELGTYLLESDDEDDEEDTDDKEVFAFHLFKEAARLQLPEAMFNVGHCYSHGIGVDKNDVEAVRWFRKAAKNGDVEALRCVGYAYNMGYGVAKNSQKAFKWYKKAAQEGDGRAMLEVGVKYREGDGVGQDLAEAWNWLNACVDSNHSCQWLAKLYMADMLYNGQMQDDDPDKVTNLYESAYEGCLEAVDNGDDEAMIHLGNFFLEGNELLEIDKNPSKAVEYYEKAANEGYAQSMNMLGVCYSNGKGVGKDILKACWWFEQAAAKGFTVAKYNLACNYLGNYILVGSK